MKKKLGIKIISAVLAITMAIPMTGGQALAAEKEGKTVSSVDSLISEYEQNRPEDEIDKYITPEYCGNVKLYQVDTVESDDPAEDEEQDMDAFLEDISDEVGNKTGSIVSRDWYSYGSKYAYARLSTNQKKLYKDFYSYALYMISTEDKKADVTQTELLRAGSATGYYHVSRKYKLSTYGMSATEMANVYNIFLYENPQFYFLNYICFTDEKQTCFWMAFYNAFINSSTRANVTNQIFNKIDSYVADVKKQPTDLAAISKAEMLIMDDNTYGWSKDDKDAYNNPKTAWNEQFDQSLYSSTMLHYTVCAGYAKALLAVLAAAGYNAVATTGHIDQRSDGGHAWNMIYYAGAWYVIDATWDDEIHDRSQKESYGVDFFMVSDQTHAKGRLYSDTFWPGAPSCDYDFDLANGSVTDTTKNTIRVSPNVSSELSRKYVPGEENVKQTPTVKLSSTKLAYNGKRRTPKVIVKVNGKALSTKYYTVTMPKGRKKVGTYTVTVKFKNGYSGTKKLKYKIVPKKLSLSKVTGGKKKLTVRWKKVKNDCQGYQVQVSTSKKFKSGKKTVTVKKASSTKAVVKKLKKGKKYYVRVRAYKKVKGKKYYSSWSKAKTVKVR